MTTGLGCQAHDEDLAVCGFLFLFYLAELGLSCGVPGFHCGT